MAETKEVNLFSDDVVIIIGAGASVPFGLPTGLDLIDLVQQRLKEEANGFSSLILRCHKEPFFRPQISDLINETPVYCALKNIHDPNSYSETVHFNLAEKELIDLSNWLGVQVSDSIDDLIRYNEDKSLLLKICITDILISRTYIKSDNSYVAKEFKSRKIQQLDKDGKAQSDKETKRPIELRNWIHNLINVVRAQFIESWRKIENWHELENKPKIKIISFNYDNILENILEDNWNAVKSQLPEYSEIFEIIHPHGKIIHSKSILFRDYPKHLFDCANSIAVIHDNDSNVSKVTLEERSKANKMISNSKNIFAIGFAFARLNSELIGLYEWKEKLGARYINYINFDGGQSLRLRIKELAGEHKLNSGNYSLIYACETKNEKGDYLQITDALMGGFLGEMPS